jgi:hypothetical protein
MHLPDIIRYFTERDLYHIFLPVTHMTEDERREYIKEIESVPGFVPSEQPLKNFEGFVGTWQGFRFHTQDRIWK